MKDFLTGSGVARRISCSQSVVIGIWMWPLSKTFLCTLLAEALCSPLLEVYNAGVVLLCHLLASAPHPSASIFFFCVSGFIYVPNTELFLYNKSSQTSTVSSPGVLQFDRPHRSPWVCVQTEIWHVQVETLCNQTFNALSCSFSGGLLICLPREQAARFCAEIKSPKYGEGHQAWIIGIVEKGNRTARIIDKPRIIEVAPQVATQNVNPTPGATS